MVHFVGAGSGAPDLITVRGNIEQKDFRSLELQGMVYKAFCPTFVPFCMLY